MRRFDYFTTKRSGFYLLNIQSDILQDLRTRIAIPLVPLKDVQSPMKRLNPIFNIHDEKLVMHTQFMSAVSISDFHINKGSLTHYHDEIIAALDFLISGI